MEFTEVKYIVSDLVEAPQVLTVESSGRTSYRSHTNEQLLDHPEIGLYETTLDSSKIRAIESLFSKWPLSEIPDHQRRMPEGSSGKLLKITTPYAEITKQVGPADPVDPRLQEMLDFFDGIVREVMKSPHQVLRLSITAPSIEPAEEIAVELQMANTGKDTLFARKPSDLASQSDGWLRIEVWPAVPEPGSMWSEQKIYIDVDRADAETEESEKSIFSPIAPGSACQFTLRGKLAGKHGRHVARVSYCNFTEWAEDRDLIVGHVLTAPVEFSIP